MENRMTHVLAAIHLSLELLLVEVREHRLLIQIRKDGI